MKTSVLQNWAIKLETHFERAKDIINDIFVTKATLLRPWKQLLLSILNFVRSRGNARRQSGFLSVLQLMA